MNPQLPPFPVGRVALAGAAVLLPCVARWWTICHLSRIASPLVVEVVFAGLFTIGLVLAVVSVRLWVSRMAMVAAYLVLMPVVLFFLTYALESACGGRSL